MGILFKNIVITDCRGQIKSDLLINNGIIEKIQDNINEDGHKVIDGDKLNVLPSFVDIHVHFRDPGFTYKEDLYSGSKSALRGGFTIVNLMANTNPIVDNNEIYKDIMDRARDIDLVDIFQTMAVTKNFEGKNLDHIDNLPENVKFLSDDGYGISSNETMYYALKKSKEHGVGIMVHAQDPFLTKIDYRLAEDVETMRDLYLAGKLGARLHMSHVSTIDSIDAIRQAKIKGYDVTCEVTPHHIALFDNNFKVNPPIRSKKDVEALIKGIQDLTIDAIATDHAPHTEEDKKNGSPGLVGLETSFAVCYTKLVETGYIELKDLSRLMSYNPAKILGIKHGIIKEGEKADIVIVDLENSFKIDSSNFVSKSKNTPFNNMEVKGKILMTIKDGIIKYKG